jgi:hypothetical protein
LFSSTFAYKRVAEQVGVSELCLDAHSWEGILSNLRIDALGDSLSQTEKFINETHSREILVEKWKTVFQIVLGNDA